MIPQVSPERFREIIEEVQEIQDEIAMQVEALANLCKEVGDRNAEIYLIAPLQIRVEQGSWLSDDLTIPQWIERLKEELPQEFDELEEDIDEDDPDSDWS